MKVVEECAASRSGHRRIYAPRGRWFGLASLYAHEADGKEFIMDCIALDDVLRNVPEIRLVKAGVRGRGTCSLRP